METFSETEDKRTYFMLLWGRSVFFQRKKAMGFRKSDSKDHNHRNSVCRVYLEVSPAKRLLLLARTSSGKTCLSATLARKLTVEDSPSSLGSLFQCCSTCLPKLGRFCHLCMSSSSSCRLLGCSHAPPNIAQHMVYLLCSLQYWITFHL